MTKKEKEKIALTKLSKLKLKDIPKEKRWIFKIIGKEFKAVAKQFLKKY